VSSVALALLVSALTTGISAPDTETSGGTLLTLAFEKPALGAQACANLTDVIEFELKTETTVLPGSDLHIWWAASSTSSCESPTEQLLNLDLQVSDSLIIEGKKTWDSLAAGDILALDGVCGTPSHHRDYKLCFGIDTTGDGIISTTLEPNAFAILSVDTTAPPKPLRPELTPLDGSLRVRAQIDPSTTGENVDDICDWQVRYREQNDTATPSDNCADWTGDGVIDIQSTTGVAEADFDVSAVNGRTYEVCVAAIDADGNRSPFSETSEAVAVDECDFIECYPDELSTGYCGQGQLPSLSILLLPMLLVWLRAVRRRRELLPFSAILLAIGIHALSPSSASASAFDSDIVFTGDEPSWQFSARVGAYNPTIANSDAGRDYYELIFLSDGDSFPLGDHPTMFTLSWDWYPLEPSTLHIMGARFGVGIWKIEGRSRRCEDAAGESTGCTTTTIATSVAGTTSTQLAIMPLSAGLLYRLVTLRHQFGVPLEPYLDVGVDYSLWWSTSGGELSHATVADGSQNKARGATPSYHVAAGIALNLDWLEPGAAARGRQSSGMAGTFFFVEGRHIGGDIFGRTDRINPSATSLEMGLAVDFL